jgi:hypothetical protein
LQPTTTDRFHFLGRLGAGLGPRVGRTIGQQVSSG